MTKVTVLMAAYNAAPFLERSLGSLAEQTIGDDMQVVCIDDASTDNTLSILKSKAREDKRFEVIHLNENRGQAYARNEGLKKARGQYVCFLDADDWLSADAIQKAVSVFEDSPETDCVLFQVDIEHVNNTERYVLPNFTTITGEEAFLLSLEWNIHGVYMVRTALHQRFPYDDTCRSFSDDNTTRMHYLASRHVACCDGVYHYWQHPDSTSHQVSVRRFDFLRANESMKRQLLNANVEQGIIRKWETIRLLVLVDCYMFYHNHARQLPADDAAYGLSEMRRVWSTLERPLIDKTVSRKFGYRLMPTWWLFRLQEWLYFTLRGLVGKNKKQ